MISFEFFSALILLSILLPAISAIGLAALDFFEYEINVLEMENKRVALENELHQSKFTQMSQQIQTHFLYNTLNIFLALGRLDRLKELITGLESLAQFLKYNYREQDALVPFSVEFRHTENYLAIQKLRFGDRLEVKCSLDPEGSDTQIPPFALQTLVENAFKHGLENKPGQKKLGIYLFRKGNWVTLAVIDNGPNDLIDKPQAKGVGLTNLKKRFDLTFYSTTEVSIFRNDKNETEVKVVWPYTPEMNG